MKNLFFKILIFLIFLVQGATVCNAQIITKQDVIPVVENSIVQNLKDKGFKKISVNVVGVPFMQLRIPDGKIIYKITSNNNQLTARSFITVSIYVNDEFIRTVGIPVKISALKDIYVAKETISRGSCLTSNLLEVKTIDITNAFVNPLEYGELNKSYVTTKVFMAGSIIDKKYLKSQPDVIKDAVVTLYFKSKDDLSITVDGIAISEGNIGDTVAVKNKKYNKVYSGTVIGTNKILVRI